MPKISAELRKIRGDRVKYLLRENKMLQRELADTIGYEPEHLSAVLNGRRTLTEDAARTIAKMFPPTRYQWILGEDDFKTEEDRFNHAFDNAENSAKVLHALIKGIASNFNYEIKILKPETLGKTASFTLKEPCYAIVDGGRVVACISFDDYVQLRKEIVHYSAYLFGNLLTRSKAQLFEPFEYPKEAD